MCLNQNALLPVVEYDSLFSQRLEVPFSIVRLISRLLGTQKIFVDTVDSLML